MSRAPAPERLNRLLTIVPWVASNDGPTVQEVCARFNVEEAELLADLDLLFLCGVYPFTPDTLIEVDVADGRVWIRFADYFRRPLRLTPGEGLALVAAGEALLAVPGADPDGALAGALAKLGA
ncbi:WYL domain-containing protein, partial [Acidimicrobiaceae bacterium USS-CC1]|nr:WYL domain-containing protein [Acidiferrimicrobium australe]